MYSQKEIKEQIEEGKEMNYYNPPARTHMLTAIAMLMYNQQYKKR